ncbi:transposition-related ATP-binding protein TniB [Malaciobacter marinus]|uniref:AAA family ATPase n=1 Tax=Malaciobacter marinus TaxID=505249 RepID=A0A347TML6_9BACT|nr:TniB family NTP-binding protein [Malaciobacter marinus]AXX87844.1 transposition-related ATP-binding protein TniB [Malaciobacter marinus]PHO16128.1 AAA family ATPase [Malaciobacter marinus]
MSKIKHYDKLTKISRTFLNKSIEERIKKCKEQVWIPYPQANNILDELEDLFDYPDKERIPGLLIVGDTNNGKTTIINRFMDKHPRYLNITNKIPIIKISAPIAPSHNALYEKLLDAYYIPYSTSDSASRKETQIKKVMRDVETKMVIIDELQDIFHGDMRQQKKFLAAIKHLSTDVQIPIIGVGVWEVQSVITADPQLANRFEPIEIKKWNPDINFAKLLVSFESTLPLKEASNLHEKDIFKLIYNMSEGLIGEVARILQKASIFALRNGKEKIDIDVLNSINFTKPSLRKK